MYSKDTVKLAVAYKDADNTFAELKALFGMTLVQNDRAVLYMNFCKEKLEDGRMPMLLVACACMTRFVGVVMTV